MPLPFTVRRTDPDAAAFCARSGASDRAALSAFVRGVKDLGLWDSMVCWPLRNSQNAGTGTTAYSLGGLGTYNGTLTNGPTWGVNGVVTQLGSPSQIITTGITYAYNASSSLIFVGALTDNGATPNRRMFGAGQNSPTSFYTVTTAGTSLATSLGIFSGAVNSTASFSELDISGFNFFAASHDATSGSNNWRAVRNADSATASFNNPAATSALQIFAGQNAGDYWGGTGAFAAYLNTVTTAAALQQLRNLYRTTLGTGLGLP